MSTKTDVVDPLCDTFSQLTFSIPTRVFSPSYKDILFAGRSKQNSSEQERIAEVAKSNIVSMEPVLPDTQLVARQNQISSLIEEIVSADIPNGVLLLQKLRLLYFTDSRYVLLFESIHILFEIDVDGLQRHVLRLILQEVFVKRTFSAIEARALFAQLAFVVKERFSSESFPVLCEEIKSMACRFLTSIMDGYIKKISDFQAIGIYSRADLRCTLLPQHVALCMILPNGRINAGMSSLLVEVLLSKQGDRDDMEKHIINVLQDLQCDKEAIGLLESIASKKLCVFGEKIINATLLRSVAAAVTSIDACQVALASCLSFWRQNNGSNCCPHSILVQRQTVGLRWFVEDIKNIFVNGCITRIDRDKEVKFFGLEVAEPCALNAPFSQERMRGTWLEGLLMTCLTIQKEHFDIVCSESPKTLRDVFNALQSLWPGLYSQRSFDEASFLLEAPNKNSCLTVLENAVGSSFYVPLRADSPPPPAPRHKNLYLTVMKIFGQLAQKNNLSELSSKMLVAVREVERGTKIPSGSIEVIRHFSNLRVLWSLSTKENRRTFPGEETLALELASGQRLFTRDALTAYLYDVFARIFYEIYPPQTAIPPAITFCKIGEYLDKNSVTNGGSIKVPGTTSIFSALEGGAVSRYKSNTVSAKDFLEWVKQLRVTSDPRLVIPVCSHNHQYLLTPNHPTLKEPIERVEERAVKIFTAPLKSHPNLAALAKISKIIVDDLVEKNCCSVKIINEEKMSDVSLPLEEVEEIKRQVHKEIDRAVGLDITFFQFIRFIEDCMRHAVIGTIQSKTPVGVDEQYSLQISTDDVYYALFLGLMNDGDSRFRNLFIHFADSNYVVTFGDKLYAVHFCLWFHPQRREWLTVRACEYPQWSPTFRIVNGDLSDIVVVDSLDEIRRESSRKLVAQELLK